MILELNKIDTIDRDVDEVVISNSNILVQKMVVNNLFFHYQNNEDVALLCAVLPNMRRYTISMMLILCLLLVEDGKLMKYVKYGVQLNKKMEKKTVCDPVFGI